jgi:hypothetical protein
MPDEPKWQVRLQIKEGDFTVIVEAAEANAAVVAAIGKLAAQGLIAKSRPARVKGKWEAKPLDA